MAFYPAFYKGMKTETPDMLGAEMYKAKLAQDARKAKQEMYTAIPSAVSGGAQAYSSFDYKNKDGTHGGNRIGDKMGEWKDKLPWGQGAQARSLRTGTDVIPPSGEVPGYDPFNMPASSPMPGANPQAAALRATPAAAAPAAQALGQQAGQQVAQQAGTQAAQQAAQAAALKAGTTAATTAGTTAATTAGTSAAAGAGTTAAASGPMAAMGPAGWAAAAAMLLKDFIV